MRRPEATSIVGSCRTCPFQVRDFVTTGECNIDGGVTPKRGTPKWCPLLIIPVGILVKHRRHNP